MDMMTNALTGKDISLSFGGIKVLKGLNVTFRAGEILALMINLICSLMSSADGATCQFFFMGYAMVLYVH
jgi:ABC-type histidine transport system ATPase subunit